MSKPIALLICFFAGSTGLHFIYMGRYHQAKVRFLWFLLFNPVAFFKSWIDTYNLSRMNKYQFDSYCRKRVSGTESKNGLKIYVDEKI
jgi:TM2 domain-containing membrane protein YozV